MRIAGGWPALLLVLAGCASISVKTDHAPGVDFGRYRSFAFLAPPDRESGLRGSLAEQRIQAAVRRELGAKGVDEDAVHPDFLVAYHVRLRERFAVEDWGYGWDPFFWGRPEVVTSYTEGTLLVDFIDPATRNVFWRGAATSVVNAPESGAKKIDKAVAKMLDQYPPEEKAAAR